MDKSIKAVSKNTEVVKAENSEVQMSPDLTNLANVLNQLAMMQNQSKSGPELHNIETVNSGNAIVIPEGMGKKQAAQELMLQHEEEEKIVDKLKTFDNWHYKDALVAIMKVLEAEFGWINSTVKQTFFGDVKPKEITVKTGTGPDDYMNAFYGDFIMASLDNGKGSTSINDAGQISLSLSVKKKFNSRVEAIFKRVEKQLKEQSIFRNKSIIWEKGEFEFIENKGTDNIVLNIEEQACLDNFILKPLKRKTAGKRGVLFSGPYGTGKTETALKIGRVGIENGYTFFYCKDRDLAKMLAISKQYQPAIIFLEDIDELVGGEERNESVNDLLNTIDGIETKGQSITLIMTTNHAEKINHAFRRPGRIDVVLTFELPKSETRSRMYRSFFNGIPGSDTLNYEKLGEITPEIQGAVIKEIADRAILLSDNGDEITQEHVELSITLTEKHIKFMQAETPVIVPTLDRLFNELVTAAVETRVTPVAANVELIKNHLIDEN